MHTINTFLFGDANELGRPWLYQRARQHFGHLRGVEFEEMWQPFGLPADLRVSIDKRYYFSLSYIDHESIHQSLAYVERITASKIPAEKLVCEVRTQFGADEHLDFDHITVFAYQFLEELPGAVVYDDNHKKILAAGIPLAR